MERLNPSAALDLLANGVTHVAGVPSIYLALLAAMEKRGVQLQGSALKLCIAGGAVVPIELQDRWATATGVELRQGYGLTEAAPVCLFNWLSAPNVRGSLGTSIPGVDVVVMDPTGTDPLPDGEVGEICVRGGNVSRGYVGGAAGLRLRGEWLSTGDAGMRDATGHFRFRGLIKPMFTRNGFNIYPREIERVVGEMTGVVRASVTAVPNATKENDIVLHVAGDVSVEEVKRWCAERLALYKQPAVIDVSAG